MAEVYTPPGERERIKTHFYYNRRKDGTFFAQYLTKEEFDNAPIGPDLGIKELSEPHHSELKAQDSVGRVFQDEKAFKRWIES